MDHIDLSITNNYEDLYKTPKSRVENSYQPPLPSGLLQEPCDTVVLHVITGEFYREYWSNVNKIINDCSTEKSMYLFIIYLFMYLFTYSFIYLM